MKEKDNEVVKNYSEDLKILNNVEFSSFSVQSRCKIYIWGKPSRVPWYSISKSSLGTPCRRRCWKRITNATRHRPWI